MKRMPFVTGWLVPLSLAVAPAPQAVVAACGSEEADGLGRGGSLRYARLVIRAALSAVALLKRLANLLPLSA